MTHIPTAKKPDFLKNYKKINSMTELKPNIGHLKHKWLNPLLKKNDFHFMLNHKAKFHCSMHIRSKSNSKGYKKCEIKDKSKIYTTKLYSKVEVKPKALNKTKKGTS